MPSITPSTSKIATASRKTTYQLVNCRLVRDGTIIKDDLWFRDGKILNPEPVFFEERIRADVVIDCHGALICPGFIDVQLNGGFGYDFSSDVDRLEEALSVVAKGILATGVTSFCPTVVTSPTSVYHQILPRIERTSGGPEGAGILGVHLEGPFISPEKKGAHPLQFIQGFQQGMSKVEDVYGRLENVAMITTAPELSGACEVIRELSSRGIVVSVVVLPSNVLLPYPGHGHDKYHSILEECKTQKIAEFAKSHRQTQHLSRHHNSHNTPTRYTRSSRKSCCCCHYYY